MHPHNTSGECSKQPTAPISRQSTAVLNQDCFLLWQISQLDNACGEIHVDLSELIATVNCTYSFICSDGQIPVQDALVDKAGIELLQKASVAWLHVACNAT